MNAMKKLHATVILSLVTCVGLSQTITKDIFRFKAIWAPNSPFDSPSTFNFSDGGLEYNLIKDVPANHFGTHIVNLDATQAFWNVIASSGTSLQRQIEYNWGAGCTDGLLDYGDAGSPSTGGEWEEGYTLWGYVRLTTPLLGSSPKVGRLSMRTGGYSFEGITAGEPLYSSSHTGLEIVSGDNSTLKPISGSIQLAGLSFVNLYNVNLEKYYVTLSTPRNYAGFRTPQEFATLLGTEGSVSGYTGVENGTYYITIRGRSCTRWSGWATVSSSGITLSNGDWVLYLGDFNEDNIINTDDWLLFSDSGLWDTFEDATWDTPDAHGITPRDFDLDHNGHIGNDDYLIMSENFDMQGN